MKSIIFTVLIGSIAGIIDIFSIAIITIILGSLIGMAGHYLNAM